MHYLNVGPRLVWGPQAGRLIKQRLSELEGTNPTPPCIDGETEPQRGVGLVQEHSVSLGACLQRPFPKRQARLTLPQKTEVGAGKGPSVS